MAVNSRWTVVGADIDQTPLGSYQILTLILVGGIIFAEGYEIQMLSSVTDAVSKDLSIQEEKSALMSMVFIGFLIGNVTGGIAADSYGRRIPILWSYFGMFLFSIVLAFGTDLGELIGLTNFTVVLVSCAGVGLAQGFGHPAVIALLGEVVQSQWRPMLFCGISSWYGAGTVVAAGVAHFDDASYHDLRWRVLLGSTAVPCFLFGLGWYVYGDESPYFLSAQNQEGGAEAVLQRMGSGAKRQQTSNRLVTLPEALRAIFVTQFGTTLVLIIAILCSDFVVFGMTYAVPQIGVGMRLEAFSIGSLIAVGNFIGLLGNGLLVCIGDRMKRSIFGSITFYGSGFAIMLMLCGMIWRSNGAAALDAEPFFAAGFVLLMIFSNAAYCILNILEVEVYRTELRATAKGCLMVIGRIGSALAFPLYEFTKSSGGLHSDDRTFCEVTLALALFAGTVVLFLRSDPRGKPLDSLEDTKHSETTALIA